MNAIPLLLALLVLQCSARNEPWSDHIAPGGAGLTGNMPGSCVARLRNGPCISKKGTALSYPPNGNVHPCPCWDTEDGVSFPGDGPRQVEIDDGTRGKFQEYTLVTGANTRNFDKITGMAFTDNTKEVFIAAKPGYVFKYDLNSGKLTQWLNIANLIHNAGDYGLLSLEVSPNFAANPQVYIVFAATAVAGDNSDMDAISWTRVVRVTQGANGLGDPSSFFYLVGKDINDAPPLCSSTHLGGAIVFGRDGSLLIAFGEGGHFDTDIMDYGQVIPTYKYDQQCINIFGRQKAIGAFRAQSKDNLGGKIVRLDPKTGSGICPGTNGYSVYNPYCNDNVNSVRSRIWAMGLRNPFSMNLKPLADGEVNDGGPGTLYFGEVGLGSFEEVNAVTRGGQNFGWPCWEGPRPMAGYRDSPMNNLGRNDIARPYNDQGQPFSCPWVYANVETTTPTFYYSRYTNGEFRGPPDYGEEYILNMGFTGNCIGGLAFYNGASYPPQYKNSLFVLDYGASWIKTLGIKDDQYKGTTSFGQWSSPMVVLETNPDTGDVCYIQMLANEIHCFRYTAAVPPTVKASASLTYGPPGMTVVFSMDGSYDPANNKVNSATWDFGDGTKANFPNPTHTFDKAGTYTVTLTVVGEKFTAASTVTITVDGNYAPLVTIVSPSTNNYYDYPTTGQIFFDAVVRSPQAYTMDWDFIMIHNNHYHPNSFTSTARNVSVDNAQMGAESHKGTRFNFLVQLTVIDARGAKGTSYVRLRPNGWQTTLGNHLPQPALTIKGNLQAGQFVRFDASATFDSDLDFLIYHWNFGDGFGIYGFDIKDSHSITSHVYHSPGTYTVTLYVEDNFGGLVTLTREINIVAGNGWVQLPASLPAKQTPDASLVGEPTKSSALPPSPTSPSECEAMFYNIQCRTASRDVTQVDAVAVKNSRQWLCANYPQFCTEITGNGKYAQCNAVEQMSYAMNAYWTANGQTAKECSFGGLGQTYATGIPSTTSSTSSTTSSTTSPIQSQNDPHGETNGSGAEPDRSRSNNQQGSAASATVGLFVLLVALAMI